MALQKYNTLDAKLVLLQIPNTETKSRSIVTQISILTSPSLYSYSFISKLMHSTEFSDELRSRVFELGKKYIAEEHVEASALMRNEERMVIRGEEASEYGVFVEIRSRSWEYRLNGRVVYVDGDKAEIANIKWQVLVEPLRE